MHLFELTLMSIFRDSESYLSRYLGQVEEAFRLNGGKCHAIWLEGDSKDATFDKLKEAKELFEKKGHQVTLVKFDLHGRYWPSLDIPDRWLQLSTCWNKCIEQLLPSRFTICVESDLIWDPSIVGQLIGKLDHLHPVVYPMLLVNNSKALFGSYWFYDTWAFEREGKKFNHIWPYWSPSADLQETEEFLELTTGGGMIVSTYECQKQASWDPTCCIMKFPKEIKIFMDKTTQIYHPESLQLQNLPGYFILLKKAKTALRKLSYQLIGREPLKSL